MTHDTVCTVENCDLRAGHAGTHEDDRDSRRVKRIIIPHEFWEQLLTTGDRPALKIDGIPETGTVIFQEWAPEHNGFSIVVQDDNFEVVPHGAILPYLVVTAEVTE